MRTAFGVVFTLLILTLMLCAYIASRSHKPLGKSVASLDVSLIPPILGNLLIISSKTKLPALIGSYIYYIGMDVVMLALISFTIQYCKNARTGHKVPKFIYVMLAIDAVQLAFNPVFGHAFDTEPVMVDNAPYYRLVPHAGQYFHRIVDYFIFTAVILIFIIITVRMPRIYKERYYSILLAMILIGLWQTFYVFSRSPVDRSMIGIGVFGLIIFYFSLFYKPVMLLDRTLSKIVSGMQDSLFVFDPNNICIWANNLGCQLVGIKDEVYEHANKQLEELFGGYEKIDQNKFERKTIGTGDSARYYLLERNPVYDNRERVIGNYLRIRDNTSEQLRVKRQMFEATHDSLTGLYTREYLYQKIKEAMHSNPDQKYLIIFIDVKNFKIVNDVFSTAFGDFALKTVGEWIGKNTSSSCIYGRLAGDTFGACIPKEEFDVRKTENDLSQFKVSEGTIDYHLLIHLGVYEVTGKDKAISVMFDRAHLALTTIKDEYQTHIAFYDKDIRDKVLWNQQISSQLHGAIAGMQIRPYLQPIADSSGQVVGAEALARWIHPEHGFMSPAAFIPVFENNGMIVEVDKHMWRCSCEILKRWKTEHPGLFISVNISPKDFYFIDVAAEIKRLVREHEIEPSRLRIEITETVMMNDVDDRMQILSDLRESGFIVEMDDFGSGYSSLNMLKDMPVDVLKIDMKFLSKTKDTGKAQTIVKNIINLSEDLGISSLTEGVETESQYHTLSEMGCKLFQGYYFSKPVPVEDFEKMVDE